MNQPKGLAIHFDPEAFSGRLDQQLLERLNLDMLDLVNTVLSVWPTFMDCPERTYEVVTEELFEIVAGDVDGNRATVLADNADHAVELCTRIYTHLHPAIQDLPDQLYHAVQNGLRGDLETGVMHVVRSLEGSKTLILSMD